MLAWRLPRGAVEHAVRRPAIARNRMRHPVRGSVTAMSTATGGVGSEDWRGLATPAPLFVPAASSAATFKQPAAPTIALARNLCPARGDQHEALA